LWWKNPGKLDVEVEGVKGGVGEKEKVLLKIKPECFLKGSLDPGEESEGSSWQWKRLRSSTGAGAFDLSG